MKRRVAFATTLLLMICGFIPPALGEDAGPAGMVRFQMFRVPGALSGETSLDEEVWRKDPKPDPAAKRALTFFTGAKFRLGKDRFDAGPAGWLWNGVPLAFDETESVALPVDKIRQIECFAVAAGLPHGGAVDNISGVEIESSQALQYFEKRSDGAFDLKSLNESTGLNVRVHWADPAPKAVRLHPEGLTIGLRVVEKRETIPGVRLPVGKPVLKTEEHHADVRLGSGKDYGILLSPGQGQGVLIIRLRVLEDPKAETDGKNGGPSAKTDQTSKEK